MDNKIVANKRSLVQTITAFENCLVGMKSTVLVPTRLNDIDSQDMQKNGFTNISADNENLFNVFNDLQKISQILFDERRRLDSKHPNRFVDMNGNNKNCEDMAEECPKEDNLLKKLDFHAKHLKVILDELCGTAGYITNVYKEDIQNMHMNYNHIEYSNNEIKHYYTSNASNDVNN